MNNWFILHKRNDWIRTYCPYCFNYNVETNTYLPLNREYSFLGIYPFINIEKTNILINQFSIPGELIDITTLISNTSGFYHLYRSSESPFVNKKYLTNYRDTLTTVLKFS